MFLPICLTFFSTIIFEEGVLKKHTVRGQQKLRRQNDTTSDCTFCVFRAPCSLAVRDSAARSQ